MYKYGPQNLRFWRTAVLYCGKL